ncbi:secreted protein containing Fumarate reductase/succinate dehydrogenase flavoprotein [Rhodopirellula maiorica SM1]|uniref:Secreted protein containing Fumarate reductase/succinate dehydrogenase flavoprotein n=1 Tax=Rhodopirellula maiorica SM1 TaxID=1265738 RepID=M5RH88_9BACT|nr:FAD-dependent oxidoreductase [Rhodopirellula maiorica]EMI18531.1 secreted protein containing Fumarate reductase/succinate dehydrogenase flavoprotein [Rhodopirellula maiorica SM1]
MTVQPKRPILVLLLLSLATIATPSLGETILVEAESFAERGGWVIDQQSMDQMGSPYLMAHGLGTPVDDATTQVKVSQPGVYHVWVRTRDWAGPWKTSDTIPAMRATGYPGKFQLKIDGETLAATFGTEQSDWHWQDGGMVRLTKPESTLTLHDLTGFNGRCDTILLTNEKGFMPPNALADLSLFRQKLLGQNDNPSEGGDYDLVVVGGGIAGICSAISAARADCRVALIQDRPVLGGNNSSEVRVGLSGLIRQKPYPNLGNLVDEISPVGHWTLWDATEHPSWPRAQEMVQMTNQFPEKKIHNAGPKSNYEDDKKLNAVKAESNLTLFLNTHVNGVEMDGDKISAVVGQDIRSGERIRFTGRLFADCTGDGTLGAMANADFRQGRESKEETQESLAPDVADELVMGTSVQWNSRTNTSPTSFPECPWAVQFDETTCVDTIKGDWDWETGANRDQVEEIERIRDYGLRVVFGNWSVLKNSAKFKDRFANRELQWVAYIGGKRESRRLMGDVVLKQQDIVSAKDFEDASVTTTWTIDLHYPSKPMCACEAFQSTAKTLKITPYPIPYRCLYSRNVDNLFMAGRNISVTHVALGTVRVQRTTGMMGEVVGMAAAICKEQSCLPREVYDTYLEDLKKQMVDGVPSGQTVLLGQTE